MDDNEELDDLGVLDNPLDSKQTSSTERVLFALCILVILGNPILIIKDIYPDPLYSMTSLISGDLMQTIQFQLELFFISHPISLFFEIASCICAILGAILMIQQKKLGFNLYIFGNLLFTGTSIWYAYFIFHTFDELLILLIISYLVPVIGFTILIASNKKHLS